MTDRFDRDPPSAFVSAWASRVVQDLSPALRGTRAPAALDVAMGRGRHALLLAAHGFRVFGVDITLDAVRSAMHEAAKRNLSLHAWCADLTAVPLPRARFDLVVVTRYLQRDLFGAIRDAVSPGGTVVYETFTVAQRALGFGPTSPDHLLEPGELRRWFEGFEMLFDEEVAAPEAVARIVARRSA